MSTKKSIKDALQNPIDFVENLPMTMKEEVGEAAMRAGDAMRNEFALWIKHESDMKQAVLFNYGKITREPTLDYDSLLKHVVGYIKISEDTFSIEHKKARWYVAFSAAEKGWGPLMYDVAFGMAYPDFVTSDRGTVSKYAQSVWNYILNNRPDVERVFLADEETLDLKHLPVPLDVRIRMFQENAKLAILANTSTSIQAFHELKSVAEDPTIFLSLDHWPIIASLLGLLKIEPPADGKVTQKQASLILKKLKAAAIEALQKEGTAYGYRLKAPTNAANGPALARVLQNGKKLEDLVNRNADGPYDQIELGRVGQDFFWNKYHH